MPFAALLPFLFAGASAAGGALNNRGKKATTAPTENPDFAPLGTALRQNVLSRLQSPMSLPGYEAQGLENINQVYRNLARSSNANLTRRGLSTSPTGADADLDLMLARGGQQAQFLNQVPLLQRQLANEDINLANSVYGRGIGSQTQQSGNVLGGALGDLGTALGYLLRQRQLGAGGGGT